MQQTLACPYPQRLCEWAFRYYSLTMAHAQHLEQLQRIWEE
jgi:hypothetical protein